VIDSIITSSQFTISITKDRAASFAIDMPTIEAIVGSTDAKMKVSSAGMRQLTFRGPEALTFAFTTVHLFVDDNGVILATPPGTDSVVLSLAADDRMLTYGLDHVELCDAPAMVEWDEVS
jgi:hypothetical protein